MQAHLAAQPPLGVIPGFACFFQTPMGHTSTLLLRSAELIHQAHMFPSGRQCCVMSWMRGHACVLAHIALPFLLCS
jgi:hypothetical protein